LTKELLSTTSEEDTYAKVKEAAQDLREIKKELRGLAEMVVELQQAIGSLQGRVERLEKRLFPLPPVAITSY